MIDRITIRVQSGSGGAGCVSFHREKFVPRGGPDGGDGGDGGSVILLADPSVRTLKELGRKRVFQAEHGRRGEGGKKHGRRGPPLVLRVPLGTEIWRGGETGSRELIAELIEDGSSSIVARGGIGGWGNARFATSVQRAPRIAQYGQRGEEADLVLELKLLADVGIVGLPNAGKSTLLRAISAARPKVADYPFTTLEAVLGMVERDWQTFVVADIPGLIEGAHRGAGLGLEFLRHVERTKLILYLVDGSSPDPLGDLRTVEAEVGEYGRGVAERPRIVAVNKIDRPEVAQRRGEISKQFAQAGMDVLLVSAAGGEGLDDLVRSLAEMVAVEGETRRGPEEPTPAVVQTPVSDVRVRREDGAFRVDGERAVAFAEMMPVETDEGRAELWRRFKRWGVSSALRRAGAKRGDRVRLGAVELEIEA
jgi:GTP-binding protein